MWWLCAMTAVAGSPVVLRGGTVVGVGPADVRIEGDRIAAVGDVGGDGDVVDVTGRFLVPAAVDSHVHLAYLPRAAAMADGGVAAVVDLAAPEPFLAAPPAPLRVLASGPMVTAVGGYPTRSWGAGGYGLEVASPDAAERAVERLLAAGAALIKVPITEPPTLDDATLARVVQTAHAHGVRVGAHALGAADAARAAAAGVDVLVHTPVERMTDDQVATWAGRAVITTLGAFGGRPDTLDNLRRLRAAGATVLYGTDFGNTRTPGVDGAEVRLLAAAGLDGEAILAAMTSTPASYWGLDGLGTLAPGSVASLLVLDADPRVDPSVLARPRAVWIDGVVRPRRP